MYIICLIKVKASYELPILQKCNEKISSFSANQVICGANSSVDDDVISDKDSVEDKEIPLISELNTGWSSKENLFPQISHKDNYPAGHVQCAFEIMIGFSFVINNHWLYFPVFMDAKHFDLI
jgi:hypothetical protein